MRGRVAEVIQHALTGSGVRLNHWSDQNGQSAISPGSSTDVCCHELDV
jgi:hypothetical protein